MKKINFIVLLLACVLLMPSCNRFDEDDFDRIEISLGVYPGLTYMKMIQSQEPANVIINSQEELVNYLKLEDAAEDGYSFPKMDFNKYSIIYATGYLANVCLFDCSVVKDKPKNLYELDILLYTDPKSEMSEWKIPVIVPKIPSDSKIEMEVNTMTY